MAENAPATSSPPHPSANLQAPVTAPADHSKPTTVSPAPLAADPPVQPTQSTTLATDAQPHAPVPQPKPAAQAAQPAVPLAQPAVHSAAVPVEHQNPIKVKKRIIVCCDGTWVDGLVLKERWKYTNILRLARTINHTDHRHNPPIPQVVFYQAGIGSEDGFKSRVIDGTTGATLAEKVQEAYGFIAHNYSQGDEIFAFGFSRGAYTARMIADIIGNIGVLDRTDMDEFAGIFINFQKRGKATDPKEIAILDEALDPWTGPNSPGRRRVNTDADAFSVKCVGVFDTVGSLGLPEEIVHTSEKMRTIFGFNARSIGEHIERGYHAMALNEMRKDFDVCKFEQTPAGKAKGQILRQTWFAGVHSDIGGGYEEHDLADLTLQWMASHVEDILSLDMKYLKATPNPAAPYGQLPPHNSLVGVYSIAATKQRDLPTTLNPVTNELFHPSVLKQKTIQPVEISKIVEKVPDLVAKLLPLEEEMKTSWPYDPAKANKADPDIAKKETTEGATEYVRTDKGHKGTLRKGLDAVQRVLTKTQVAHTEGGEPIYQDSLIGRMASEGRNGAILKELGFTG